MTLLDKYVLKQIGLATFVISIILIVIIFLIQSLRFLDIIIEAGASGNAFWILTLLALPRFFEVIVPISLMIATLFIYNKLINDSELIVMRSAGLSPLRLSFPALFFAGFITVCMYVNSGWVAPTSLMNMEQTMNVIKTQASSFLFKEGVFTNLSKKITAYIQHKQQNGTLEGILIYDKRKKDEPPITILAKRGSLLIDSDNNKRVIVYEGSRQQYFPDEKKLERLEFNRYILNFPKESDDLDIRGYEPEERTLPDLIFNRDDQNNKNPQFKRNLMAELHKRLTAPFMALTFASICLACLMSGTFDRRGISKRLLIAAITGICIQGMYLGSFNYAQKNTTGIAVMYLLAFLPFAASILYLKMMPTLNHFRIRKG